jgi:hypothetical protein
MIKPKEFEIGGKTYILSKFPATDGREIVTQYVSSGLPKIGDYKRNEELMYKLMCFVAVKLDSGPLLLTTKALVNNHCEDFEILMKIEAAMMDYNCSFFRDGRASTFLDGIAQKALALITKILTASSVQSSPMVKQPSTNSEQSIV